MTKDRIRRLISLSVDYWVQRYRELPFDADEELKALQAEFEAWDPVEPPSLIDALTWEIETFTNDPGYPSSTLEIERVNKLMAIRTALQAEEERRQ